MISSSSLIRAWFATAITCLAAAGMSMVSPALAEAPAETPIEAFATLPDFSGAKLSPGGGSVAYSVQYEGRKAVIFQNLDGSERGLIPAPEDSEISSFYWANDRVLLVKVGALMRRSEFRDQTFNTRIFSFDRETNNFLWLGKPKRRLRATRSGNEHVSLHERIVDFLWEDPDNILMAMDFDLNGESEVFRVNVRSGSRRPVRRERNNIHSWHTDHNSEIRLGIGFRSDEWFTIYKTEKDGWINLDKTDWGKKYDFEGFSPDPQIIYVSGQTDSGTKGLFSIDVETGEIIEKLFSHPEYDISSVTEHPITGHVSGVAYVDDHYRITYFDKDLALIKRSINKALPDTVNYIAGQAKEKRLYLIYSASDTVPGAYYLFDRDQGQLHFITSAYPNIDVTKSAVTRRVDIPVRDGSTIPAYLTIPHHTDTPRTMPTVVLPHGGPQARDTADWDYWAQFLADRGYLVIKPNFRGSTGFGPAFQEAGENQWGGLMQDDVTDATHWIVEKGYADPNRICIVGASYGGYASLMGVIKEPDLYQCAISVNGVTDIPSMKANDRNFIGGKAWGKKWGLEGKRDEDISPYDRAEEINTPVLIMASRDDRRVPYDQSAKLHDRLEKLGKETRYVKIESGDHYMVTAASRATLLSETEKFLKAHIGND
ncbi:MULTISPECIES: alpha/beta hydrolase family protein [Kordiimonas]|uniref:alpha/beta hydrolase family protein n=1 Tax=Kordiimonas TaxID=288021 RepID=UPI00257F71ED|nr:S9 family peptidase [Kordiimonas sp. UBA4487]